MEKEARIKATIWRWCLHCERAFQGGSDRHCEYDGCDGHFGDIWTWESIREHNPSYPEIPDTGVIYPLYCS